MSFAKTKLMKRGANITTPNNSVIPSIQLTNTTPDALTFVFVESFALKWNGDTARNISGVSGTHASSMYLAEAFGQQGHNVFYVNSHNNMIETTYNGVRYINYANFQLDKCDYIIATYMLRDLLIINKIKEFEKIIFLMNNDFYEHQIYRRQFEAIPTNKVIIGYLTEFGKTNVENLQPFTKKYANMIIPNSIDLNDIKPFHSDEKSQMMAFFACEGRGFKLAMEIVKKLCDYKMYANTYANENSLFKSAFSETFIVKSENTSKTAVFDCLVKSRYFIYPLINLDNNHIHYDTFAYVVLEALLHGVVVICPPIKVYTDLYGDAIYYIDTAGIIPEDDLIHWRKYNPNFGYPLMDKYIEAVRKLDSDESLRQSYIQKGLALRDRYSHTNVSAELLKRIRP